MYFMSSLVQCDIPEGKSSQQVLDSLQKKIELAGAERSGNWLVECETYYSVQNLGTITILKCFQNYFFEGLEFQVIHDGT